MRNYFRILPIIILVIVISANTLIRLFTDWLWFQEVGMTELFSTPLKAQLAIGLAVGILTFLILYVNLRFAMPRAASDQIAFRFIEGKFQIDMSKYGRLIATLVVLVLSFFTGLVGAANWDTALAYLNATPFGLSDPIFNRDIGFYFFTLPFVQLVVGLLSWVLILALITAALLYGVRGAFRLSRRMIEFAPRARVHLFLLAAAFFVLAGIRIWYIKISNLLLSSHELFVGASYTNLHANLPLLKLMALAAALIALILIILTVRRRTLLPLYAIGAYIALSIAGQAYPWAIQRFIVAPNELAKEAQPIERNIAATRAAYGLNAVEERDLSGDATLTSLDILHNAPTINNIRLWDREPLLDTFGQLQEIRTYYDFVDVDNDRYHLNGAYRQVLLSTRELNAGALPSDTFNNRHFVFTHGYGLTLSPVNEVTPEGLPVLFIKDIPPSSALETLKITRPEIYFGQLSHEPIFVKTNIQEFDYPAGDENVFTTYAGHGGVPVGNLARKALFAMRFRSLKILLSNDIQPESQVIYYRNIHDRVARLAPFLEFDRDPYLVITKDGRLVWIQDAYTISNRYPYAQYTALAQFTTFNYIRNSVKITIDAYDGSVQLYIADPTDPIIATYAKIFPDSFKSLSQMPEDLRAHLRYPEDLFAYQTALYTTYHMKDAGIFYNKEDQWQIPTLGRKDDPKMRHLIMKLPGEDTEEFILMLPFTPKGKDNLAAWMVARSDGEQYGKLVIYRFPKQTLVFGPQQIQNRINQDTEISRQISLWDQRGSEVIRGSLLVIPIEEALLYVQPLYLRAEGGRIPELKRVIVAYENQIAMEETLDIALSRIFSGASLTIDPPLTGRRAGGESPPPVRTNDELFRQARSHYDAALKAQRDGNWSLYGEEIKALGEVLKKLGN
jgi:uncharacterized membrane protein (UPF0182 family)